MKFSFSLLTTAIAALSLSSASASALPPNNLQRRTPFNDVYRSEFCQSSDAKKKCETAALAQYSAQVEAEDNFARWSLDLGNGDAFQHCLWSALMATSIDVEFSKAISDLQENGLKTESHKKMDMLNHEIGRNCGATASTGKDEQAKYSAAWLCCMNKVKSLPRQLYVLREYENGDELPEPKCCIP